MMILPDAERASVDLRELTSYLLDLSHERGGSKARVFIAHGYSRTDPGRLRRDLLDLARTHPVVGSRETAFGINMVVDGEVVAPNGRTCPYEPFGKSATMRLARDSYRRILTERAGLRYERNHL